MEVINNCARLIDANIGGTVYRLLPAGESVIVPNDAEKKSPHFAGLIKDGSVRVLKAKTSGAKVVAKEEEPEVVDAPETEDED